MTFHGLAPANTNPGIIEIRDSGRKDNTLKILRPACVGSDIFQTGPVSVPVFNIEMCTAVMLILA